MKTEAGVMDGIYGGDGFGDEKKSENLPLTIIRKKWQSADEILDHIGVQNRHILKVFLLSSFTWATTATFFMIGAFLDNNCDYSQPHDGLVADCVDRRDGSLIFEYSLFGSIAHRKHWFTSSFMLGNIFGGSVISYFSDLYGRRKLALFSLFTLALFSSPYLFVVNYETVLIIRFIQGGLCTGAGVAVWVLGYESIPAKLRPFTTFAFGVSWVIGYCVAAPLAYFIPDWRQLNFVISLPILAYAVVLTVWLPESLHFLVTKKREAETRKWVADCGETVLLEEIDWNSLCRSKTPDASTRTSLLQTLATNRKLLLRLAVFSFLWTTDVLVYFGMSLFSVLLAGNRYLNYVAIGLIEVPAYIVGPIMLDRLGRRCTVSSTHFGTAVAFLLAAFVLTENAWAQLIFWLLAKFLISTAFMSIFAFASESFPTAERSVCVGFCTVMGKLFGCAAPFVESTNSIWCYLPLVIFGVLSAIAGVVTLFLPETKGKPLPDTNAKII